MALEISEFSSVSVVKVATQLPIKSTVFTAGLTTAKNNTL